MITNSLTVQEREIYSFIRTYMRKSKSLTFEAAVDRCRFELQNSFSSLEISKTIESLLEKKFIIKGTTLCRDEVLENQVRSKIMKFIQVNPGAYNRLIRRGLSIGSNEFTWHIGILEKFGMLKKILFHNRHYAYFENKSFMDHEYDLYLLKNTKIERLLNAIEKTPKTTSQIATGLGIHYSTIQRYLKILVERKLVLNAEDHPDGGQFTKKSRQAHYLTNQEMLIKIRKIVNGGVFLDFGDLYPEETILSG